MAKLAATLMAGDMSGGGMWQSRCRNPKVGASGIHGRNRSKNKIKKHEQKTIGSISCTIR